MQTLSQPYELALFAGAGGGILGGKLLGWRTVCAVEWDAYARDVLVARQNDGCLDPFPIWDDVQTFDGRPWRGRVDVVSGGFPCQDISAAGKGAGIEGERSGMWKHMARIIGEVLPQFVLVENSPMLVGRGLGMVLADLAALGYDARWGIVGAHHAGAPHKRDRIWIVAHAKSEGLERQRSVPGQSEIAESRNHGGPLSNANGIYGNNGRHGASQICREQRREPSILSGSESDVANAGCAHGQRGAHQRGAADWQAGERNQATNHDQRCGEMESRNSGQWWESEPDVGRVAHGVASRVDRLRAIGNGQVPAVAALAFKLLKP